jgi:hypothetical protein
MPGRRNRVRGSALEPSMPGIAGEAHDKAAGATDGDRERHALA